MDSKKDIVIITDIGTIEQGGLLAMITMLSLLDDNKVKINIKGIITTHLYSNQRAKLVKLLLSEFNSSDIKVYAGNETRKKIFEENKLLPTEFGLPHDVKKEGEKEEFSNFMKGFYEHFDEKYIDDMKVQTKSGVDFLTEELSERTKDNKLCVICLAPMHDIALIPSDLYPNMDLYTIGGDFEDDIDKFVKLKKTKLNISKLGYNWNICPKITNTVLEKLNENKQQMKIISPELVKHKGVCIPLEVYNKWNKLEKETSISKITKAIMRNWFYCVKENKLEQHMNMCNPLILLLAITENYKTLSFKTFVKLETTETDKNNIFQMTLNENGNTRLIVDFNSNINYRIIKMIEDKLFPYDRELLCKKISSQIEGDDVFFRFDKKEQVDTKLLRKDILTKMKLPDKTRIVQIIGDSAFPYSVEKTLFVKNEILKILHKGDLLEWGVTGKSKDEEESFETNHIASDIIDTHDFVSIGNIVDYHTTTALKYWRCTYSRRNKYYILVHDDMKAMFGDDIHISDFVCDVTICVEGGIQAFHQCCNALLQNKEIIFIGNVRNDIGKTYFSTYTFFEYLSKISDLIKMNDDNIKKNVDKYLEMFKLYDPEQKDACTKQKLFDNAMIVFNKDKLWERINRLVKFIVKP